MMILYFKLIFITRKQLNVPENKGLLHNFKFDLEIPFAPLA